MPYGKTHVKSTATSEKEYTRLEGKGSVKSDELEIARSLSEGLPSAVNRAMQIAYEAHEHQKRRY